MKAQEFNRNFEIDRSSRGVKANEKPQLVKIEWPDLPDGTKFDPATKYYFFDAAAMAVRDTLGLRLINETHLGTNCLKVVALESIHRNRSAALDAGEKYCVREIQKLKDKIREFELEKPPKDRTIKYVLMGRE